VLCASRADGASADKEVCMDVLFEKLEKDSINPIRANFNDSGWDLFACSEAQLEIRKINGIDYIVNLVYDTGIRVAFPENTCGFVYPRSSIKKYDLFLSNSIGVIDEGYRGSIKVAFRPIVPVIADVGLSQIKIYEKGDRIAQLVITRRENFSMVEGSVGIGTSRSTGGFGSSGVS
jgi:dUTP pyrophosphatase